MKRTFSPSLHLTAILSKSCCSWFGCRRARSRCPASPAFDLPFFTLSFTSKHPKRTSRHVRWVGADENVYISRLVFWVFLFFFFILMKGTFKFSLFICLFWSPTQPRVYWRKIAGKRQENVRQGRGRWFDWLIFL